MSDSLLDTSAEILHCPTCAAEQPWADVCRRCKSDLGLLVAALHTLRRLHLTCLAALDAEDTSAALSAARQRWELSPDQTSARLLALCHARLGDYEVVEHLLNIMRQ